MSALIAFLKMCIRKLAALLSRENTEVVDYYGCPNSKRAQKLQLKKRIIK